MSEDHQVAASLKRVTTLCGAAAALLGLLGFVGWIFGSRLLGGLGPAYFPMAPSTALVFMLLGTILALHGGEPQSRRGAVLAVALVGLVTVFGLLEAVGFFIGTDLTYEELLFPIHEKFGVVPLYQISPIAGFIFFLAGIAMLLLRFMNRWAYRQLAGSLGSLVGLAGFVATVGYLFGTPLLYGGSIIPLAATTAIAFILLGNGLAAAAGPDAFPVRFLAGPTVQARLLRLLIPLSVVAIILHGLAQQFIDSVTHLNHALLTALVVLVFVMVTGVVVTGASRVISQTLERALAERVRAEKNLHQSEQMLHLVLDSIPVGVFWKDRDLHYLGCNATTAQGAGFSNPQAIIGKTDFDLPWKAAAESYRADDRQVMETGMPRINFEETIAMSDGSLRWAKTSKVPLRDQDGTIFGVLGVYEDITERKQAEEALQQNEATLRSILRAAPMGIGLVVERKIGWTNEQISRLTGYSGEELWDQNARMLYESDAEYERVGRVKYAEIDLHGIGSIETRWRRKDGNRLDIFLSSTPIDPANLSAGVVFTALDITERKQAEEELRTAARKWDTTFNGISDAIALLDINCQILQGNQAMADLVGKSLPEILGRNCWELVHDTLGPIEGGPLGRMKESGHRETLTISMGDRWLHVMVDPIFNESGQVVGGVHIIADITERKIAQDKIQDLNTLLKAIKEVNEALLRVKSEPELFQQTCELLTQVPYVRFVWIGLKEPDSFVVQPAAWAGQEEGYLSAIRVTWDDSPHGQGPIGTAIKTGQPVVMKDTATDFTYDPWREEGLHRGYLSAIALPLVHEGITQGSLSVYAGKPEAFGQEELEFLNQVAGDIAVGIRSLRLAQRLEQSLQQMQIISQQTVEALAATVEIRDPYTSGHQQRTTRLALALAVEMGLAEDCFEGLRKAASLHDIGKIIVPSEILSKPGRLNEYEMHLIRAHSQAGYDILSKIDFPWPVAQIVLQHHERLDGSGYPQGLQGPDILQEAKILAVADVVEAMASHRPYRPSLGIDLALAEISKNKGVLYDPDLVDVCVKLFTKKEFSFEA